MTRNGKHAAIAGTLLTAATALHVYDRHLLSAEYSDWFWFLWAMWPYAACLIVLILSREGLHVIVATAVALAFDVWTAYAVFTSDSSTAVLDFLWMPIWNLIIIIPAAMGITLLAIKLRERRSKREAVT